MVLDMARPKYTKSTKKLGMRGRDAARKLTLKVDISQVFTIDFSEFQFIVNHNSQSDGQNKSAKRWTNLHKKTIHFISLQRNRKDTNDNGISHLEQVRQKWAMKLRSDFRAAVSIINRLHWESVENEKVEEPISPEQYRRWHPSSSTSWWDKSEWNWKWAHKICLSDLFFVPVDFVYCRWRSTVTDGWV